jgi:NADP-dependent 3-hydroxy acid dehydrogenase YdfG
LDTRLVAKGLNVATNNKTVWFITGTSSGVGEAVALAALNRGDRVVATARRPETLSKRISHYADRVLPIQLDVRNEQEAHQAVSEAVAAFGRIDVVVNSAGYGLFGPVEMATDEQAGAVFETNFFGVLNVLRAALPVLRGQRSGHVVQIL